MTDPVQLDAFEWRQIVDGATDTAIISTNIKGEVTSWNQGAQRILGWTEGEMIGVTLDRVFTPEGQQDGAFAREMSDAIAKGRGGGEEGWRVRKDGSRFWAVGELTPIRTRDGAIAGFIKILRNRTAQRGAEEEVRRDRRTLEVLNHAASALAVETDRQRVVQIVTDAGVELTGAKFGAFFYTVPAKRRFSWSRMMTMFGRTRWRSCASSVIGSSKPTMDRQRVRLLERQFRVDLLFTDVVLPGGMTGAQVAAQARGAKPTLKVLFTTGYARNAIVHHGRLDQGVQLITKPFSMSDLAKRVRDVLDGVA